MSKYIIGIDEVGRGPLLGPVAVGIVLIENTEYEKIKAENIFQAGKDSKKLTPKKREEYFAKIKELKYGGVLRYGVFFESNEVIDKFGITGAIRMAIKKGLKNIHFEEEFLYENYLVLLDGSLRAPVEYPNQQSIIRGDESELVISLASIAAKVTRDEKMVKLAEEILHYDLKNNKGYGTAKHIADLKQHGPHPLHRKSFIKGIMAKS
jgi:ribonuclease HII